MMNFEEPAAQTPDFTFIVAVLARTARPRTLSERKNVNLPPAFDVVEPMRRDPRHRVTFRPARQEPAGEAIRPVSHRAEARRRVMRVRNGLWCPGPDPEPPGPEPGPPAGADVVVAVQFRVPLSQAGVWPVAD